MTRVILWITMLISLNLPTFLFGQNNEKFLISGIIESENKEKMAFHEIYLFQNSDNKLLKTELTDENGTFNFQSISKGNYTLKINSGGELKTIETIDLQNNIELGTLTVISQTKQIQEVVIEKKKPFIERKLDKLVVNVENSIASTGSTILEVLQRSPGVMVNEDSGINLKGKSGVVVMIDGKPSPLSGADLITYLKSIPASNIQTIEIISNPSARYDAAGNAGIINIKFKKDKNQGFNGSATVAYGQGVYVKPSANTSLNYRNKKWNFFGSYSYSNPKNFTYFFINRKFFDANQNLESTFEQESYTKQPISSNNARFGVDFYSTEKTIIGVLFNGNWNTNERNGRTNATITDSNGQLDYTTKTNILLDENRFNGFANLNFKHTFSSGKELSTDIDFGSFDSKTLQDIQNINSNPDGSVISDSKLATNQTGVINVKSIKADYSQAFSEKSKLEIGLKSSLVSSDNDVKFYDVIGNENVLDITRSNHFLYDENINALYGSYATSYKKWDFQGGLRIENTNTKGEQLATNETFSRDYTNFFPNLVVNRTLSENNSLSFTYAKRIDRPTYRQLNPFKIFVDSYTYVVGDPTLNSVITNLFEINHTFKGKYSTTLSYTKSKESITDIFVQDDDTKISYQIPANIQDFEQYNLGIYIPFNYKKIVTSTLSGSVYLNKYSSALQGGNLQQNFTSWDMNLNNTFTLGKGWSAELTGYYQSKMVWGLFYIKDLAQITAGIQRVSKDKNSTLKLSISDIFLTNHIAVEVDYQNQEFYTDRTWDSRVATISYTYRFGKNTVAKARQRSGGVDDEKRRAG
ncbi:outer membrane beta-barrel protein [Flavobacterium sp.]|uniref:outer membrane beta-barrel protein n=1 Tax=Flavobacterium sp. TaxID=239 RepID=UPI0026073D45|nr:outer membrane beta-barrel protein [Flavobacterium sp.]